MLWQILQSPPPSESENIVYGNTTVKDKLDSLTTDVSNNQTSINSITNTLSSAIKWYSYPNNDIDAVSSDVFCIYAGLINSAAYITFNIWWIRLQFAATDHLQYRCKYGSSAWSSWKSL